MNVVIYARFSSHSQTEQSIEGQLRICHEFASREKYTIVGEYIDRAISGRTDDRPQFQKMISDSKRHIFDAVLVYALDRFSRDVEQSAHYENKLNKQGVCLLSATESNDNSASGRMYRNMMKTFAQYYSDELSQKIRRGMNESGFKCQVLGSNPGLGFKTDKNTKKYVIDEATAPVVKRIFEMYAEGATVADICRYMNSHGVKTSRGNEFNKNSLRKMLTNKRYIGIYTFKGKETPGGMPRIIDDDLFYAVQEKMQKNKKAPARARAKEEYLLTTKLFCGHCKEMMTGYSGTGKSGKVHHYYICNGVKRRNGCNKKTVQKQYIEDLVIAVCRKMLTDENIASIIEGLTKAIEAQPKNMELETFRKELKTIEKKRTNLLNAVAECEIDVVRKSLYEQLAAVEARRSELEFNISVEESRDVQFTPEMIEFFLLSLRTGDADDLVYRKALISVFINKIYLYDDKITIHVTTGGDPVEITGQIISDVEASNAEAECSFKGLSAPPYPTPFGVGFFSFPGTPVPGFLLFCMKCADSGHSYPGGDQMRSELCHEAVCAVFADAGDFVQRELRCGGHTVYAYMIDGLIASAYASDYVFKPLSRLPEGSMAALYGAALDGTIYNNVAAPCADVQTVASKLVNGFCVVLFPGVGAAAFEVKTPEKRSVSAPTVEHTIKGPKDAFTETVRTNTSLLRRHLRTPDLRIAQSVVGSRTLTNTAVVWIDGVTDPELVARLQRRLARLDTQELLSPSSVEEYVTGSRATPFPLLQYTERPDRFADGLLSGRVGLLVDGLPLGYLLPVDLGHLMTSPEDKGMDFVSASLIRVLRYGALALSLLLPAVYVALASFHQQMIPLALLRSIIESKQSVPFSTAGEVFALLIAFELLQEAGIHLPQSVGQSVSIIGGIVVGTAAVEASLISPAALIVVSLAGVCGFALPNRDLAQAVRLFRFAFAALGAFAGLFGVTVGFLGMLIHLASLSSLDVPYLMPFSGGSARQLLRPRLTRQGEENE